MKRHQWGVSKRAISNHASIYEECQVCGVERIAGRWHYLKRPDRHGISKKWRKPWEINGPPLCPGKPQAKEEA